MALLYPGCVTFRRTLIVASAALAMAGCGATAHTAGSGRPPSAEALYATCADGLPEVFYTVPPDPTSQPFRVATAIGGVPLASWIEPAGQPHPPVVTGLPAGDAGQVYAVTALDRTARVAIPRC